MIHSYILCLCEEAAVIADKSRGFCLKYHLMCASAGFYDVLLLLFPTKVNIQQSAVEQDVAEPSWKEMRGYRPALRY